MGVLKCGKETKICDKLIKAINIDERYCRILILHKFLIPRLNCFASNYENIKNVNIYIAI